MHFVILMLRACCSCDLSKSFCLRISNSWASASVSLFCSLVVIDVSAALSNSANFAAMLGCSLKDFLE